MPDPAESLIGKPLTITLPNGEKRVVGTITAVRTNLDGDSIYFAAEVTDGEIKGRLKA